MLTQSIVGHDLQRTGSLLKFASEIAEITAPPPTTSWGQSANARYDHLPEGSS